MKLDLLKQFGAFIILALIGIYFYGFGHETAHFIACKSLDLESNIEINLLKNPPQYFTNCPRADELSDSGRFIVLSAPYFLSLIILSILLIYFKPRYCWHLAVPSAIFLSDGFNLFEFLSKPMNLQNDIYKIASLSNKSYLILILSIIGLSLIFYLLIGFKFLMIENKQASKKENSIK